MSHSPPAVSVLPDPTPAPGQMSLRQGDLPTGAVVVRLVPETSLMDAAMARASALAEVSEPFRQSLEALLSLPDDSQQLVRLDCDSAATSGTGELIVRFYPGDGLCRLLAAEGAGDV